MKHPIERSKYIQVYQRQLEEELEVIEYGSFWREVKAKGQSLNNPLRVALVLGTYLTGAIKNGAGCACFTK